MAEAPQNRETQTGTPSQAVAVQPSTTPQLAPPATQTPYQPGRSPREEVLQRKIADILGELLAKSQEVGFELATLECPKANECPLVKKSRELITLLKKLFEIRKELPTK